MTSHSPTQNCVLCGKAFPPNTLTSADLVRDSVIRQIKLSYPDWPGKGLICRPELNAFRDAYVRSLIAADQRELSSLEIDVIESLNRHETLATNPEKAWQTQASVGERLSDKVATFGGSWRFIIMFFCFILVWMALNVGLLVSDPLDPYPFIFLNLMLSCLAAIQAPIIMMSQNRQEARDRLRSQNDYKINLKAELEIRQLHEKVDHLLRGQWERLMEIQQIQIDLMEELTQRLPKKG